MRCARHGLATGHDGQCVLCRREAPRQQPVPTALGGTAAATWLGPNLLLAVMVTLATAGFLVSRAAAGLGPLAPATPPGSDVEAAEPETENSVADLREDEYRAALKLVEINVYYAPWCPACKAARAWLRAEQIPYRGFDVQQDPSAARRLRELNPAGSIPTIEIDGKVAVGFDQRRLQKMIDTAVARQAENL